MLQTKAQLKAGESMSIFDLKNLWQQFIKSNSSQNEEDSLRKLLALSEGQRRVFEKLTQQKPIEEMFSALIEVFESYYDHMIGYVALLDKSDDSLRVVAGPSLAPALSSSLNGIRVGPQSGGCGTAAHFKRKVIINDTQSSQLCRGFEEVLADNQIKSCWSQPVFGRDNRLLGVFSMLSREPISNGFVESMFMESAANLVGLALESKWDEQASRATEEKFQSIFNTAGVPVVVTDRNYNILEWNPAAEELFEYKRAEVLGENGLQFIAPGKDPQPIHDERMRLMQGETEKFRIEVPIVTKSGKEKTLLWDATLLKGETHSDVRLIGIAQDITERKRTEEVLLRAKMNAEAANEAKSNFIANMNHELRTPLAAISGLVDLLGDESSNESAKDQYITKIKSNVHHLTTIVDDLLDLSKLETGHIRLSKSQIQLKTFLEESLSPLKNVAERKGLNFEIDYAPQLPEKIYTDEVRLRQILNNVVGNAIKFTSSGTISVHVTAHPLSKHKYLFVARVKDSGCGVELAYKDEIFKPFVQADSKATRNYEGTGLGLSIARRLAEALGGRIELEKSTPNHGSEFLIEILSDASQFIDELPSKAEQIGPGEKLKSSHTKIFEGEQTPLAPLRILLAEDHPDIQLITHHLLQPFAKQIDVVNNGQLAVERALANSYDLILMDIQMPIMDGFSATQILREKGYKSPIVALTARSLKNELSQYLEQGFDHCLTKPLSPEALIKVIESCQISN